MRIYISGPISGTTDYRQRFAKAEAELQEMGYDTINPARLGSVASDLTHKQYMKLCLKLLRMADAIYMLEGYEYSKGAMIEFRRAHVYPNIKKIYTEAEGYPPEAKA